MKQFMAGVIVGFLVLGCAGATIPWPYYGLQLTAYKNGHLYAVNPANDKDISFCQPGAGQLGKCIIMDGPDFYAFKQDDLTCHTDLVACQKNCR